METFSLIVSLLTAITLFIFIVIVILDAKNQHSIKIAYAKLICILTLILFSIVDLIIHIIMNDKLVLTIIVLIVWIANLLLCISSIKSRKKSNLLKEKIEELENTLC